MSAAAIFASLGAVVWHPARLGVGAMLVALVAAGMAGGSRERLARTAVMISAVCWVAGMVVAIVFERPIF
jgi:hypothetical protein